LKQEESIWKVENKEADFRGKHVLIATGSTPSVWDTLGSMGYKIVEPVPSLFTFNIQHKLLEELQGLSMPNAEVEVMNTAFHESGPLLITHWGLSGPGILKLSAWGARELHAMNYRFSIKVNWIGISSEDVNELIDEERKANPRRVAKKYPQFGIPRRFWERFCYMARLHDSNWASLSRQQMDDLVMYLTACEFNVNGKSTFKEEFVTCGGVDTQQVDFRTMESKLHKGLYFAGEVLNIDAITGGFNFQAAWTEAFIAAEDMAQA
jgi:predicted Rossmann fold flavoprotein